MISCVSYENLDEFGALFPAIFKLRYEAFIERQGYNVRVFGGMEYDQYDSPASAYLVYHEGQSVLGVSRLTPTTHGCMLEDIWPELVEDKSLFKNELVWEGTRYCIAKNVPSVLRTRIIHEMARAYLEFGLAHGLRRIIGMMPTYIYRSVFERPGINVEYLGPIQKIGRHRIRAVAMPIEQAQLKSVQSKTGLKTSVLRTTLALGAKPNEYQRAA